MDKRIRTTVKSAYQPLVAAENELDRLNRVKLGLERDNTQIDKILRMKKLARLELQFSHFAGDEEKREYERLLVCENGRFFRH